MKNGFLQVLNRLNAASLHQQNIWIIVGTTFVVMVGVLALLFFPAGGWINVIFAFVAVGMITKSFVGLCSTTIRQDEFDVIDLVGFSLAALAVLSAVLGLFAVIYRQFGLSCSTKETHEPWTCLYFSVITWTTVGYGDLAPLPGSRPFAALEAMIGYICMALLTATIIQIITKYKPSPTVRGTDLISDKH